MRDIKFRAWDKKLNDKTNKPSMLFDLISVFQYMTKSIWCKKTKDNFVFMQYTGLKDKNGVEIYEGDVVKHENFIGHVKYISKGNCNVLGYALSCIKTCRILYMYCDEADNYEIIGNIYENEELLR